MTSRLSGRLAALALLVASGSLHAFGCSGGRFEGKNDDGGSGGSATGGSSRGGTSPGGEGGEGDTTGTGGASGCSLACENTGRCVAGADGDHCECPAGFTGDRCETNVDDCDPNP